MSWIDGAQASGRNQADARIRRVMRVWRIFATYVAAVAGIFATSGIAILALKAMFPDMADRAARSCPTHAGASRRRRVLMTPHHRAGRHPAALRLLPGWDTGRALTDGARLSRSPVPRPQTWSSRASAARGARARVLESAVDRTSRRVLVFGHRRRGQESSSAYSCSRLLIVGRPACDVATAACFGVLHVDPTAPQSWRSLGLYLGSWPSRTAARCRHRLHVVTTRLHVQTALGARWRIARATPSSPPAASCSSWRVSRGCDGQRRHRRPPCECCGAPHHGGTLRHAFRGGHNGRADAALRRHDACDRGAVRSRGRRRRLRAQAVEGPGRAPGAAGLSRQLLSRAGARPGRVDPRDPGGPESPRWRRFEERSARGKVTPQGAGKSSLRKPKSRSEPRPSRSVIRAEADPADPLPPNRRAGHRDASRGERRAPRRALRGGAPRRRLHVRRVSTESGIPDFRSRAGCGSATIRIPSWRDSSAASPVVVGTGRRRAVYP